MIRNEGYRMGLNLGKNEMIEDPEITTKIYILDGKDEYNGNTN